VGDDVQHVPGEVIHTAEGAGNELIDPVLQHTERITNLETGLTASEERLNTRIIDTEAQLREAIAANAAQSTIEALEARIVALEAKLEDKGVHPVETIEAAPGQAAAFVVPAVEESPANPAKERRSIRHRRKNRGKAKS
jgi:hypothetical protein